MASVSVLAFHPAQLGLFVAPVPGGAVAPTGPTGVLARAGALAALNGPMFDNCPGQAIPSGNASYAVSSCSELLYAHYDRAAGLAVPGAHPTQGITLSVVGGEAVATPGSARDPRASVAVQLYPSLIVDGRIVTSPTVNRDAVWRSGLGLLRDGRLAFFVGKMPMDAFARALFENGAVQAGYTDGGGSTALVTLQGVTGSSEARRVASWLVVRPLPASSGISWVWVAGIGLVTAAWFLGRVKAKK